MATRSVRFEFKCNGGAKVLRYSFQVPSALVRPDGQAMQQDPTYMQLFCENCGKPTVKTLMTPMSWMHNVSDPFVNVWVTPACSKGTCETKLRQLVQTTMHMIAGSAAGASSSSASDSATVELIPCQICGKLDGTKKCGKCKVVAYCGRDHQVQDWPAHKKVCTQKA
ncbi:uncharacterized protein DNG_07834 [Cephalotrichum gorgonifer]|uniref:MYND-type domain-containing protein n=1 Tax=Cephalotrichum gorgonifer TaxID=2041049 RepID=A0AAE8N4C4_9PEZI|nr:uncharacterized protein DNG_07834 [Cephalotrichum gorgonifer]